MILTLIASGTVANYHLADENEEKKRKEKNFELALQMTAGNDFRIRVFAIMDGPDGPSHQKYFTFTIDYVVGIQNADHRE